MDLRQLTPLTAPVGGFATVYLDVSHDSENAEHEGDLRWSEQRSRLEKQGADAETLEALDDAVRTARPAASRSGRVLVARAGELLLDRDLPRDRSLIVARPRAGLPRAPAAPPAVERLAQEVDAVLEPLRPHDPRDAAVFGLIMAALPLLLIVVAVLL
jgi:hypothetical protein